MVSVESQGHPSRFENPILRPRLEMTDMTVCANILQIYDRVLTIVGAPAPTDKSNSAILNCYIPEVATGTLNAYAFVLVRNGSSEVVNRLVDKRLLPSFKCIDIRQSRIRAFNLVIASVRIDTGYAAGTR